MTAKEHEETFGDVRNVPKLFYGDKCTTYKFIKNHWTVLLQWVNFMVCKLYTLKHVAENMVMEELILDGENTM